MDPVSAPAATQRRPSPFAAGGAVGRAFANPYILLVLTMAMWGGNAVVGRLAVGAVSPMALVAARWVMVSLVLLPIVRKRFVAEWPILRHRWRFILTMGTIGFTLPNVMYFGAAHMTSGINMAILPGGIPIFVLLGVMIFHRTRAKLVQVAGVALTICGILTIASKGHLSVLRNLNFNPGDLLIVANTMLYATYTIFLRDRPKEASSLVVFAGMAGAALFTALPLLGYEVASGHVIWPTTARGWFAIFYIGLATSLVSQLMFIRAVELIGPSRSGLFVNLVPVFGALMAVGILGEPFGLYHALALVLVVGGILLAESPVLRRILRRQPPLETAPRAAAPAEPRHG